MKTNNTVNKMVELFMETNVGESAVTYELYKKAIDSLKASFIEPENDDYSCFNNEFHRELKRRKIKIKWIKGNGEKIGLPQYVCEFSKCDETKINSVVDKKKCANTISIGNAGEYFVAGELERRGFTAAVPMSNTKDFDILAIRRDDSTKQYAIQVKTTTKRKKEWTLSKKNEELVADSIFYVFVSMIDNEAPSFHIVPSKIVAAQIKREHDEWLATPGKNSQQHNDNNMRKFRDEENIYLDKWYLIGQLTNLK